MQIAPVAWSNKTFHAIAALRKDLRRSVDEIRSIRLRVNPLVRLLMGNATPQTGLEAKLSVQHCAAAAFIFGKVGIREFTEECVLHADVLAVRARVSLVEEAAMPKDAAHISLTTVDGTARELYVPQATGSLEKPLSDAALTEKFHALAAWGCPAADAPQLAAMAWALDTVPDAGAFARAAAGR